MAKKRPASKSPKAPAKVNTFVARGREINTQRYSGGGRPCPPSHGPALNN